MPNRTATTNRQEFCRLNYLSRFLLIMASLLLSGCVALHPIKPLSEQAASPGCRPALTALDRLAEEYAGTLLDHRLRGTPWLRSNRFLSSFNKVRLNKRQLVTLLRHMQNSARAGLQTEITHIPANHRRQWQKTYGIQTTDHVFVKDCVTQLLNQQLKNIAQTRTWLTQVAVRDSYSTLQRLAGLYPVVAIPFRSGVIREQQKLRGDWGKVGGQRWWRYIPPEPPPQPVTWSADSLGIPRLTDLQTKQILQQYAPTWLINSQSPANLPGTPYRGPGGLKVATEHPVIYAAISFGRWKNQITTRLNYLIWFKERPPLRPLDWVAGQHDAVIFRIHLDAAQQILAYDSVHLCGCWYRLFLPETARYRENKSSDAEPVLAQTVHAAPRMAVYLARDTHHIIDLQPAGHEQTKVNVTPYQLQPFNKLKQLPVFNTKGYVPGSERPERWFFWPMGVRNAGALRRFGEHAISFIGKRHFDDPYLLENIGMY